MFFLIAGISNKSQSTYETPWRRAGRIGEEEVTQIIRMAMRDDDRLFTNVEISVEDKRTELDNVIVNKYGVFIIEAKNYSGTLSGDEDDNDWEKMHISGAGNMYCKTVENPIHQVKRHIFILSRYLDYYGAKTWVRGYTILVENNSPVESDYVLSDVNDVDVAVHTPDRERLTPQKIEKISRLLSD